MQTSDCGDVYSVTSGGKIGLAQLSSTPHTSRSIPNAVVTIASRGGARAPPRQPINWQFDIHVGLFHDGGQPARGLRELQTYEAVGAAGVLLGLKAHAPMAVFNRELGLSRGMIQRCFEYVFGIAVTRANSAHSVIRSGRHCEGAYQKIRATVRASPSVVANEPGIREMRPK